jgi:hypothetical protein
MFTSYVEQCTGPVYKLVDCGHCCSVRHNYNNHEETYSAALFTLTQFTICIGKQSNGEQGIFNYFSFEFSFFLTLFVFPSTACLAALSNLVPKLSEAIQTDWRFEVVREALDCLADLLKELKGVVIKSEGHIDTVFMSIKMVFYKMVQLT